MLCPIVVLVVAGSKRGIIRLEKQKAVPCSVVDDTRRNQPNKRRLFDVTSNMNNNCAPSLLLCLHAFCHQMQLSALQFAVCVGLSKFTKLKSPKLLWQSAATLIGKPKVDKLLRACEDDLARKVRGRIL